MSQDPGSGRSPSSDNLVAMMSATLDDLKSNESDDILEPTLVDEALAEAQMAWYIAYRTG